jgi:hypothetical protein
MTRKEIRKELVDSYAEGRMNRRDFLRKLTATGVSVGAALTYASVIGAEKAIAKTIPEELPPRDFYEQEEPELEAHGGEWSGNTTEGHVHWHGGRRTRKHHGGSHRKRHHHEHVHPVIGGVVQQNESA